MPYQRISDEVQGGLVQQSAELLDRQAAGLAPLVHGAPRRQLSLYRNPQVVAVVARAVAAGRVEAVEVVAAGGGAAGVTQGAVVGVVDVATASVRPLEALGSTAVHHLPTGNDLWLQ